LIGRFTPSLEFCRSYGSFSRSCVIWSYATFLCIGHGSDYMILGYGAVIVLAERQSGETIFSALPEPILNVDMLIVTFKFLPRLTAHENTLLLYYRCF
jgi:hypothetical protein